MYSINPSFQTNHKPNDSLILLNLCWRISFPFMKQGRTQHRFPPRSAPGFVWFQSFPRRGIPQRVAYCRVCLETWMMCHQYQSSWRIVSHVFFYHPIIQIWLTHRSRIWIPTQVVDISQNWDFGKSITCFFSHMMDLAEVATFRFSSGIFGTSWCTWCSIWRRTLHDEHCSWSMLDRYSYSRHLYVDRMLSNMFLVHIKMPAAHGGTDDNKNNTRFISNIKKYNRKIDNHHIMYAWCT